MNKLDPALLLVLLCGCHGAGPTVPEPAQPIPSVPSTAQATAVLNAWYRTEPDCLWFHSVRLPATYPDAQAPPPKDYDVLLSARLIGVSGPLPHSALVDGTHLDLTPLARASWRADPQNPALGNLCFGSPEVQSVESVKPVHDPTFGDIAEIEYTAKLQHPAAWTSVHSLENGFPKMFLQVHQALPGSASLKWKDGAWQVAAGPADVVPGPAGSVR